MHSTQSNQPVQSPLPTVLFRWLSLNKVPLWRYVGPREDGVEENLVNMSPEGAAELRSRFAMARCALEEGQWDTALSSLLRCRDILKGEEPRVGKLSNGLLVLWAEFPLAQMYQLRGSAEGSAQMLAKAVETWSEIFDGIMSFIMTSAELDTKLLSFLYTAQYECGCANGDFEMKAQAMQNYAALMGYEKEDAAEPELCLLLSYDYYWSGTFECSLKWIQKANRLWQQILPPAYLRWEVYVLMKLHRFKEALSALDRLSSTQVPAVEVANRAEEVRRWRQDCYMQMHNNSTSDGDLQEPNKDEELPPELQYAMEYSLTLNSNHEQAVQHGNIEAATPVKQIIDEMLTPDLTSVRSWLSVEHLKTVESHVLKLPEGPRVAILKDLHRSSNAFNQKQFELAIFQLNGCRELLRIIKKCIEDEAYYAILASMDHRLADLYQFCEHLGFQFEKALETRKELLNCIQHVAPSDKYMEQHYTSLVILTEYQGCPPEDVSREQIVQKYASLMGMNKEQAECDMCFWLFFRDRCLWTKLPRLQNQVMPRWEHSGINYSLSYPHLIRSEVELLLDTAAFLMQGSGDGASALEMAETFLKQAEVTLNGLIQRFEGQSSYEAWVHSMLEECYLKRSKCAAAAGDHEGAGLYQEMADIESALHLSLVQKLGLHEVKKPPSIAVTNRTQLIQVEEHIMEQYYWVRFPSAHYLAFQKLYVIGRYAQDEGDWECAIFNLELCRDLLKGLKEQFRNTEFDSSLAWVDLPLVQLYQMKMRNLKKSLDLRKEVRDCIGSFKVVDPYVQLTVHANLHAAIYLFGHSNFPSLMDEIMDEIMKLVPKSSIDGGMDKYMDQIRQLVPKVKAVGSLNEIRNEVVNMGEIKQLVPMLRTDGAGKPREFWEFFILSVGQNFWKYYIVSILLYWHFVQGDYETALDIVGILKQVVEKHFPEDQEKIDENVGFEADCLMELKMFQDANLVLKQASKGKKFEQLSRRIQQSIQMCTYGISGVHAAVFEASRNVALYYLRISGAYAQRLQKFEVAAYCHTLCIIIIEAAKNDPSNRNGVHQASNIITEYRGQPGWYDYFQLGISLGKMFKTKMRRNRESLWSHPHSSSVDLQEGPSIQDKDFSTALLSFQEQIKLLVNPAFIARANHEILKLYATMDESYFGYLLIKYGLKDAHAVHFDLGIADKNDVNLIEDENHEKKAHFNLTSTEQSILEEVEANMIKYGRRTALQFANCLYAMKGRYTESWINMLEGHKDVYAKLQKHYLNKMFLEALTSQDTSQAQRQGSIDEYRWKAFLYAERQRSRVLLYQLGPEKLTSLVARQLWEFDTNDLYAMDTIQGHVAASEKDSVFVEYNHLQEDVWIIYIVQDDKLNHYVLTMKSEMKRLKEAINNILLLVNGKPKKEYNDVKMNADLEYLHNLLIKPIASHLCQMKLQHKLILAPTELLAKVPFAALRDSTRPDKEKYLVQRHTISLVPSLRAFKRCNERLEALQKLDPHVDPGAIVALGHPTYGRDGRKTPLDDLPGTKNEVDDLTHQFHNIPVVKLLREDATAEKLLHWVENPLHKSSRQVIVHIGAHGKVDEHDDRNSCLFLATSAPTGKSTVAGKTRMDAETVDIQVDEEHDEVGVKSSRMDDELDVMVDEENYEVDEELVKKLSNAIDQTIGEVEKGKEKDKGKGKVEGTEKENSKEKDKGKEDECIEPAEPSIEKVIEWAEKSIEQVMVYWEVFVEYPELKTKLKDPSKKLGPHVCSTLALKDISDSKIPWRAELVVLSACHTSQGKATAEGLANLARAFIIAGVPCVVASQWSVIDEYTPVLMKEFYHNLRHGNDVASSLRSAMTSMIEAGHHVRAWAPFVIWGSSSLVLPEYLRPVD